MLQCLVLQNSADYAIRALKRKNRLVSMWSLKWILNTFSFDCFYNKTKMRTRQGEERLTMKTIVPIRIRSIAKQTTGCMLVGLNCIRFCVRNDENTFFLCLFIPKLVYFKVPLHNPCYPAWSGHLSFILRQRQAASKFVQCQPLAWPNSSDLFRMKSASSRLRASFSPFFACNRSEAKFSNIVHFSFIIHLWDVLS